jgi:UDPglucose 6-dehydrogenase
MHAGLLFNARFPGVPIVGMTSDESEFLKYSLNCLLASKLMLFNELSSLCRALDCDWGRVHAAIMGDGRIAHTHTQVPGPDGRPGFGGACFPKDLSALLSFAAEAEVEVPVFQAVFAENLAIRGDYDWARRKGAVADPL